MGQAKARGSREDRVTLAVEKRRVEGIRRMEAERARQLASEAAARAAEEAHRKRLAALPPAQLDRTMQARRFDHALSMRLALASGALMGALMPPPPPRKINLDGIENLDDFHKELQR